MTTPQSIEEILEEGFRLGHIAVPEGSSWLRTALTTLQLAHQDEMRDVKNAHKELVELIKSERKAYQAKELDIENLLATAREEGAREERGRILDTLERLLCHKHGGVLPDGKIPAAILVEDIMTALTPENDPAND